ncbi:MAG: hypothetical protein KDK70_43635, partial [Myxococcales bacterium]|nr:hypothetical protein [Myxococcales bacterium]
MMISGVLLPPSSSLAAAVAVVAVAVLGLFGYMVANSGPDEERAQAIADADPIDPAAERLAAEQAAGIDATTTVPAETTTTTGEAAAPDAYAPLDLDAFCRGGRSFLTLIEQLGPILDGRDLGSLQRWIGDNRQAWDDSLSTLAAGAPPIQADDLVAWRSVWDE